MGRGEPHDEVGVDDWMDKRNLITSVNAGSLPYTYIQSFILMEWGGEQRGK